MHRYRADLRLLPNSVDLERYRFEARRRPRPLLVWLRAFHRIYNPFLALQVVASLAREFPDIHLTMIGPDKGDGTLQAAARMSRDMGIADRITFQGPVPKSEVAYWLSTADIFLNTSNVDNTPISVLEAMASGLCVVSTDVGGLQYLMTDERDALLVPPADPQRFVGAVRRLLTEPGLAESLSTNARRKAEKSAWSGILPEWERLFTEAANGAGSLGLS
jgi:glycosyltransferase involved in cell wall biosynthesis